MAYLNPNTILDIKYRVFDLDMQPFFSIDFTVFLVYNNYIDY